MTQKINTPKLVLTEEQGMTIVRILNEVYHGIISKTDGFVQIFNVIEEVVEKHNITNKQVELK